MYMYSYMSCAALMHFTRFETNCVVIGGGGGGGDVRKVKQEKKEMAKFPRNI